MIVPLIDAGRLAIAEPTGSNQTLTAARPALIERIRYWSLLGKVAVDGTANWPQTELESVARATGGLVELHLSSAGRSEADCLELLNQGASAIFFPQKNNQVSVPAFMPPGSWRLLIDSQDLESAGSHPDSKLRERQTRLNTPDPQEFAQLDRRGIDVQVEVNDLERNPNLLADLLQAVLVSDRADGLWPTVVVDEIGLVLGLAYSSYESLQDALTHRRGTYFSRSRDQLWVKGLTSGNTQRLLGVRVDCDRDSLRFQVTQDGAGFCHLQNYSCFGFERSIAAVVHRLSERLQSDDEGSFTKKLVHDPQMLQTKLLEEAQELAKAQTPEEVAFEAADVMYFSLVKMLASGASLSQVYQELARRMTRVIRRKNKLES